jgi:hypothetical protein
LRGAAGNRLSKIAQTGRLIERTLAVKPSQRLAATRSTSGEEGVMDEGPRYRAHANGCLMAAIKAKQSYYRDLNLRIAGAWMALARHEDAIAELMASWDEGETQLAGGSLSGTDASPRGVEFAASFPIWSEGIVSLPDQNSAHAVAAMV